MIDVIVGEKSTPIEPQSTESAPHKVDITPQRRSLAPQLFFIFAALLYMVLAIKTIDAKYVDFGDGNYLYISWRLAEGDILYKDIPSPQPPLHLFLGKLFLSLTSGDEFLIRLWQVIQHVLIGCCVVGIASRIFSNTAIAYLAGMIYLFLPEGVWWAAGYQSEGLLILFQTFSVLLLLNAVHRNKPSSALYGAAVLSAMCCYINMTALPYMLLQWFFIGYRFRPLFKSYSIALLTPGILMFIVMNIYSSGEYIEHVFNRQVGTFPSDSIRSALTYALSKLYTDGGDILYYEGSFVFAAIAGIFLYSGDEENTFAKDYVIWWAIFSLGSIIFVAKGGTVEYIFTLGEPAVAVFSAFFLYTLFLAAEVSLHPRKIFRNAVNFGKFTLLICLFLPVLVMKPCGLLFRTFANHSGPSGVFELNHESMVQIANYIKFNCPEEPPAYAFLAKRQIAQNASSTFILGIAYFNEWERFVNEEPYLLDLPVQTELDWGTRNGFLFDRHYYNTQTVYDLARIFAENPELQTTYPVIQTFLDIRQQIIDREIPFILANARHVFFCVPVLHQAIRDYCREVDPKIALTPREEILRFYKVK